MCFVVKYIGVFRATREEQIIEIIQLQKDFLTSNLKSVYDMPEKLYCIGNIELLKTKCIAVIGSRNCSNYGREMAKKITKELVENGITVVSGLARGIDSYAHFGGLKQTIAVLGSGFNKFYPHENIELAKEILKNNGLLISEYELNEEPKPQNFPKRNRIVAGMIDCLIVVESASKGGALITAEIANAYDREVFALPGRIGDVYSIGCNNMIKDNKANILVDVNNLRSIMRWDEDKKVVPKQMRMFREFSEDEKLVMNLFEENAVVYLDKIITETSLSPTKIASILLSLEFDGVLSALPGKRYQKL